MQKLHCVLLYINIEKKRIPRVETICPRFTPLCSLIIQYASMVCMNILIEPLIIFLVLFFPGLYYSLSVVSLESTLFTLFDLNQELMRIITYNIPALCLIWYFLLKEPICSELGSLKPAKKDFLPIIKVVFGLVMVGLAVSALTNLVFPITSKGIQIDGILPWIIIVLSCITTGYAEESYFRVYLFHHLRLSGIAPRNIMIVSCVLFALCHAYQGTAGIFSSFFAGLFLSYMYMKTRSVHGIALGHGLYNITSYILANFHSVSGVSM